jgi:uncharacterized protein
MMSIRVTVVGSVIATLLMMGSSLLPGQEETPLTPAKKVADARIPLLLITGANNHDWKWTSRNLTKVLEESGRFRVTITEKPAEILIQPKELAKYKAFVLNYNGPRWGDAAESAFLEAVKGGMGVSVIHAANNSFPGWVEYEKLVALCWRKGTGHGRFHPFAVKVMDRDHPITKDMVDLRNHPDELYHRLVPMHDTDYRVLATAQSSKKSGGTGNDEPMIIVKNYGKGRIFHTPLGHVWAKVPGSRASYADPQFRHLVCRGTEWAATGEVTMSARVPNFLTTEEKKAGFQLLFNGRTLDGWRGFKQEEAPKKGWSVQDGTLHHAEGGGGGDLLTVDQYGDFDFRFEWKVAKKSNSGVIYHAQDRLSSTYWTGLEYQILDDAHHEKTAAKHRAGALYDLVIPVGKVLEKTGEWNTGRIVVKSGRTHHYLNGVKIVDIPIVGPEWDALVAGSKFKNWAEFGKFPKGHIALQDHVSAVWYRSIRIKSLDQ